MMIGFKAITTCKYNDWTLWFGGTVKLMVSEDKLNMYNDAQTLYVYAKSSFSLDALTTHLCLQQSS